MSSSAMSGSHDAMSTGGTGAQGSMASSAMGSTDHMAKPMKHKSHHHTKMTSSAMPKPQ
jgi:hypothetical protein